MIASAGAFMFGVHNHRNGEIRSSDSQGQRRCQATLVPEGDQYMGAAVTEFSDNVTETLTNPHIDCVFSEGDHIYIWKATILFISIGRARYRLSGGFHNLTRTIVRFGIGVDMFSYNLYVRNVRPW